MAEGYVDYRLCLPSSAVVIIVPEHDAVKEVSTLHESPLRPSAEHLQEEGLNLLLPALLPPQEADGVNGHRVVVDPAHRMGVADSDIRCPWKSPAQRLYVLEPRW